uniref:Anaphase-promoting complex subunit 4 WD40 domain-containing protein n=1 Tax=Pinguiococcus pyrenoidosus TaxID=172671 RepID=A0A7R9U581_9STRA
MTKEEEEEAGEGFVVGAVDDEAEEMVVDEDGFAMQVGDLEGEEAEDQEIRPTDRLLVTANTEEDYSVLEIYVYDPNEANLYVHHDVTIPTFPLSLVWLGLTPGKGPDAAAGSYVAVGTFDPVVEIWNLDVLDPIEPVATLGGEGASSTSAARKMKKGKQRKRNASSHQDAVMTLASNKFADHVLASGSADNTVKLWDLAELTVTETLTHHSDKVQACSWHPFEASILGTAGFDKRACVVDARTPKGSALSMMLTSDSEDLAWDPLLGHQLFATTDDGNVVLFDIRNAAEPVFRFKAHDGAASSVVPGATRGCMLTTCGIDKVARVWDTRQVPQGISSSGEINMEGLVNEKNLAAGQLFSMRISEGTGSDLILAAAGSKGYPAIWDLEQEESVAQRFQITGPSEATAGEAPASGTGDASGRDAKAGQDQANGMEETDDGSMLEVTETLSETPRPHVADPAEKSKKKKRKKKGKKK